MAPLGATVMATAMVTYRKIEMESVKYHSVFITHHTQVFYFICVWIRLPGTHPVGNSCCPPIKTPFRQHQHFMDEKLMSGIKQKHDHCEGQR